MGLGGIAVARGQMAMVPLILHGHGGDGPRQLCLVRAGAMARL